MPNVLEGKNQITQNYKIGIVQSKFNEFVTEKLLDGCIKTLVEKGIKSDNIDIIKVPGAFEIPTMTANMLQQNTYSSIICIGAVIKGETPHFDYICSSISNEIVRLGSLSGIPVIFGILTTDTVDQAIERAGGKVGNKGSEAASSAIEMISILERMYQNHQHSSSCNHDNGHNHDHHL